MVKTKNKFGVIIIYAISLAVLIHIISNIDTPFLSKNKFLINQALIIVTLSLFLFKIKNYSTNKKLFFSLLLIIFFEIFNMILLIILGLFLLNREINVILNVIKDIFLIRLFAEFVYCAVLTFIAFAITKIKG